MAGQGGLAWKVVGLASAAAAGIAARKVITSTWRLTTGDDPPVNPEDPETAWREAVAWAVFSGATVGLARMFMARKLADYWRRSTGALPPGVESVGP
jgi:hypothetical protein